MHVREGADHTPPHVPSYCGHANIVHNIQSYPGQARQVERYHPYPNPPPPRKKANQQGKTPAEGQITLVPTHMHPALVDEPLLFKEGAHSVRIIAFGLV